MASAPDICYSRHWNHHIHCYSATLFFNFSISKFFISVAIAPVCDLTSSDKHELLSNFAISCSQTTVHSSSPPVAGADSQTCASTTSADTWWSCSPWVRTRPSSTPSATSSRCRRSWRNSTDVAASVLHERTRHRWPPDLHYMPYGRNELTMGLRNLSCRFSFPSHVWLQFCDKKKNDKEVSFITYLIAICGRSKHDASIQTW